MEISMVDSVNPISIEITVESEALKRDAFYNVCFITENDEAPRTIEVRTLNELMHYGYKRDSLAYNFCLTVFAQQGIPSVFVRAKRSDESYSEAFKSESNADYYFVVIESKDEEEIKTFNSYLTSSDDFKLQFYSSSSKPILGRKLVHYYSDFTLRMSEYMAGDSTKLVGDSINLAGRTTNYERARISEMYLVKALKSPLEVEEVYNIDAKYFQLARVAYPEAAWIAECANYFPSRVQWLYKTLIKTEVMDVKNIPEGSTSTAVIMNRKVTVGSGITSEGYVIHEQVALDWVRWAIGRKVWKVLYNSAKISSNTGGIDLIKNEIRSVLDLATEESVFSKYRVEEVYISKDKETVKARFSATLMHSIIGASASGSLYH